MFVKSRYYRVDLFILLLIIMASYDVHADLKLESVHPALGVMGTDLEVTLKGTGFDENTRVTMGPYAGNEHAIIGSLDALGYSFGVTFFDDLAYVAADWNGLWVIDVKDPWNPLVIGSVDTPHAAMGVTVVGEVAYVADMESGLQVVDVSNPSEPNVVGSINTPGTAFDVAVVDNYAYVADYTAGLQVINISDPAHPVLVGSADTPDAAISVTVEGSLAYIADRWNGLVVMDISDPAQPDIIISAWTPDAALGVTVVNEVAYIAICQGGIEIINFSSPQSPQTIGFIDTPGCAWNIEVLGNKAYVADEWGGVQIIDVSQPLNARIISSVDTPGKAWDIAVTDNTAYVADEDGGLQVLDTSHLQKTEVLGSLALPDAANGVSVVGNLAYVAADRSGGLQVINVGNPKDPQKIGWVDTPHAAVAVRVAGEKAYVADVESGLQIIDVSNPERPRILGSVVTPGYAWDVEVDGNNAFVADLHGGLQVIDITISSDPKIIGSVIMPGEARSVSVASNIAYVAAGQGGLQIIDVEDPQNPKSIGSINTPGKSMSVGIAGNLAFVADAESGLQIIDVSNPVSPQILKSVNTQESAYDVSIAGNIAYVMDARGGLQLIEISDPLRSQIIGSVATDPAGFVQDVTVDGNKAYLAGGNGLFILPLPVEIKPVSVMSDTSVSVKLDSPSVPGNYTIQVFNETESEKLDGVVSFMDFADYQKQGKKKAIIVSGYRNQTDDSLWSRTWRCANMAYLSLMSQGYKGVDWNNLLYLSPKTIDLDGDEQNDVTASPTWQGLQDTIETWAQGADELLLFMTTDHADTETFQLNENETLSAGDLDSWLDEFQETTEARVILIIDSYKSGSFIPILTPPAGYERIVITSCNSDEYALFENEGLLSFSYQLWAHIQIDARLSSAFITASKMVENNQSPLLDSNGDGIPNQINDVISDIIIGKGGVAASAMPEINNASEDQVLYSDSFASFWVSNVSGLNPVVRVWAVIVAPGYISPDEPVMDFPTVELNDLDGDGTYEGNYAEFFSVGTYQVLVFAIDEEDKISLPAKINIYQTGPDIYENDNSPGQASVIVVDEELPQLHNFHNTSDEDWNKFNANSGESYTIEAFNLGSNCNVVIELYDTDGETLLDSQDTAEDPNAVEVLVWICPMDGFYYVKIRHFDPDVFGQETEYNLMVKSYIGKCISDFDDDGDIEGADLAYLITRYGQSDCCGASGEKCEGDINGDCHVDHNDLEMFALSFGQSVCSQF